MIAVNDLGELTALHFFLVDPHFHTLLEVCPTLAIAGDDLGNSTWELRQKLPKLPKECQLMSSKECHPSIFEGKSAAERHPQLPDPRIAT